MITARFKQRSHHTRPIPSRPVRPAACSKIQADLSLYIIMRADAYNCAFRSHHLLRFNTGLGVKSAAEPWNEHLETLFGAGLSVISAALCVKSAVERST